MSQKQLRQKDFVIRLEDRLIESGNKKLQKLQREDLEDLIWLFFDELTLCLHKGYRVIFDGWISFYTNPVKRKCYDTSSNDAGVSSGDRRASRLSYKHRVRFNPLKNFRQQAETELTEAEYLVLRKQLDEIKRINRIKHSQK